MSDDVIDFEEAKLRILRQRVRTIPDTPRPKKSRFSIEDGDIVYELGGSCEGHALIFTPELARAFAGRLYRLANEIDRSALRERGGCTRCWTEKGHCRCPPPPPIHWPTACHIGKRLAARDARLYHGKLRSPQLAEKPSQVTCKHCKRRMPTLVGPDGADVVA